MIRNILLAAAVLSASLAFADDEAKAEVPAYPVSVVVDGNVITGQAPGAALLFALVVLKALMGEGAARKVARGLVTDVL